MFLIVTKAIAGNDLFYCGPRSHAYLGSVPYLPYQDNAHYYADRQEAERDMAALRRLGHRDVEIRETRHTINPYYERTYCQWHVGDHRVALQASGHPIAKNGCAQLIDALA